MKTAGAPPELSGKAEYLNKKRSKNKPYIKNENNI
jgi:hypothetical protein|tara:strand:- start:337 stop:441 length:105 start_codon:yes stop_codon:yes gene_type:complete